MKHLFDNNRDWVTARRQEDARFFADLEHQQSPEYLWIGCSDSRVPANEIVGLPPGELFVHRNVANLVVDDDLNGLSVLQYAVDVLQVKHIIVCGHYGCGGVAAALAGQELGLIDSWIQHIVELKREYDAELSAKSTQREKADLLCEINVREQVKNTCATTVVREAWQRGQSLIVHGWIYNIGDGLLQDLECTVAGPREQHDGGSGAPIP